ncbi:MAG: hypothetical protein IJR52_11100 [Selenomonadaceae bacterium]|nr:hypothetical protein [Selenomonadaceae bacterium]MBQ9498104.1 hypothetical protein [Selenomonadaceae bacterium]
MDGLARGNVTLHPTGLLSSVTVTAAQKKSKAQQTKNFSQPDKRVDQKFIR